MAKIITTNYKNIELRRTSYGSLIIRSQTKYL